jgi:membrane-associated phospholipid phosphatase
VSNLLPLRVLILAGVVLVCSALPARPDPTPASAPTTSGAQADGLLARSDGWYAAASAAGVAASALGDGWVWRESQASQTPQMRGLARLAEHLGNPLVVGPALLASYATGRLTGLPHLSAASARVAGAALGASVLGEGIKLAVGRARPGTAPGDPDEFRPFGRLDSSFPSGHTTFAFAAASAIHGETRARWVPWVVYPAAASVGWSRVRENEHWLSDVVAGAALGLWSGRKIDRMERERGLFSRATFLARGSRRSFRLGFQTRF